MKKSKSNIVSQNSAFLENMEKQSDGILANTAMPSTRDTGIVAVNHELAVSAVTSVTNTSQVTVMKSKNILIRQDQLLQSVNTNLASRITMKVPFENFE